MKVQFLEQPAEQDAQLRLWGLRREPLIEAVQWARTFYTDCTALDPKGFHFSIAYARCARRVRELLIPTQHWKRDDMDNQTAVRNDSLRLRLYPCNFCDAAADKSRDPTNISEKGPAAQRNALDNPDLFASLERYVPDAKVEIVRGYTTLILGMNFEAEFAKAEVAVPVRFSDGRFSSYAIRVPLLDGLTPPGAVGIAPIRDSDGGGVFGEVDIPVKAVS